MNKTIFVVFGSFLAGTASGFILGYCYMKKKNNEEIACYEKALYSKTVDDLKYNAKSDPETPAVTEKVKTIVQNDPSKIVSQGPAKLATPIEPGIDYTAYAKKIAEPLAPTDGDDTELEGPEEIDEESMMENYEERVDRELKMINDELQSYVAKKGNSIDVLGKVNIDNDYPDIRYEEEELLWFIPDQVLTDAMGNFVDEEDLIGDKLRKFGWFQNGQEDIWVRNNPLTRDYHVKKIDEDYEEYFPYKKEEK